MNIHIEESDLNAAVDRLLPLFPTHNHERLKRAVEQWLTNNAEGMLEDIEFHLGGGDRLLAVGYHQFHRSIN